MTAEGTKFLDRGLWRNPMSFLGISMSALAALLIVILFIIDMLRTAHSPYLGVLIFFILPILFMAGFLLFGWGMWDERNKRRKESVTDIPRFPILDLNIGTHRIRFIAFMAVAVVTALLLTVIAYEAYHFTESLTFCGELCHEVMEPEAVASQNSPHARVTCAGCHVGPGAGWYVKSKLAGTRQMFAVLLDSFPRPIPPAIQHLRPARETCEECHWPEKFYGSKLRVRTHYSFDEKNTPHDISMLVKIGGGDETEEGGSGIHWHMLAEKNVTFVAADPGLQIIPLVWEEFPDGRVVEYKLEGWEGELEGGHGEDARLVDCVVCHNRPTHIYRSPQQSMDMALLAGAIDVTLPYIKRKGVEVLVAEYESREKAFPAIEKGIKDFYQSEYPEMATSRIEDIDKAVETLQHIYEKNFFPKMNVSWKAYPDNIGHRDFPGCFRCHDGKHVSEDGKVIRRECVICHTMPERGPSKHWAEGYPAGENWESFHPWDLKGKHAEMNCSRCHSGGIPPARDCGTCHEE
ncbi:MAG: NapC/NirT family cytochrome c, partial [bacterium]